MLERLTLKNFQAHQKLVVDLDPHVTTIIGPSDVGKSAVIRALLWLATNRPSGDAFIREGTTLTTVDLKIDGQTIERKRGKGENSYTISGKVLKAFGNDIPTEITQLLNLSPINSQQQHDSPFWFSETAGEISRQLNQIVNLEVIDSTLANLDKSGRESRTRIKVLEGQLEEAKEIRSSLGWTKQAETDLSRAEGLRETAQQAHLLADRLAILVQNGKSYRVTLETARKVQESAQVGLIAGNKWSDLREKAEGLRKLLVLSTEAQNILSRPIPNVGPLKVLHQQLKDTKDRVFHLQTMIKNVRQTKFQADDARVASKAMYDKFKKELGNQCPLCGSKL